MHRFHHDSGVTRGATQTLPAKREVPRSLSTQKKYADRLRAVRKVLSRAGDRIERTEQNQSLAREGKASFGEEDTGTDAGGQKRRVMAEIAEIYSAGQMRGRRQWQPQRRGAGSVKAQCRNVRNYFTEQATTCGARSKAKSSEKEESNAAGLFEFDIR